MISSMLKDIEYFNSKLDKIDGFGELGNRLVKLANEKGVAEQPSSKNETSQASKEESEETKPAES